MYPLTLDLGQSILCLHFHLFLQFSTTVFCIILTASTPTNTYVFISIFSPIVCPLPKIERIQTSSQNKEMK